MNGADWNPYLAKLAQLDERRLRELVKDFPPQWMSSAERVFDHLLQGAEVPSKLELELERSLHL